MGILIVSFLEHQQLNANLQKGRSDGSGLTASLMIKLAKKKKKKKEKEKSIDGVGSA